MVYLKMDEATAKSMEIQVFLTSAAGLSYLSFGIKTWVISKFAEDLGLNVDTYRGGHDNWDTFVNFFFNFLNFSKGSKLIPRAENWRICCPP